MSEIVTTDLTQLAAEINEGHRQCMQAMRSTLGWAVWVGERLNAAKAKVNHGDWLPWIGANCEFSERTASEYMRIARDFPQLKSADSADLTISGALEMLKKPKELSVTGDYQVENFAKVKANRAKRLNLEDAKRVIDALSAVDPSEFSEKLLIKIRMKLREVLEDLDERIGDDTNAYYSEQIDAVNDCQ